MSILLDTEKGIQFSKFWFDKYSQQIRKNSYCLILIRSVFQKKNYNNLGKI